MLFRTLKRMIERGQIEEIDIFYAAQKLTSTEYQELITMLAKENIL